MLAVSVSPASRALYDVSGSAKMRNTMRSARSGHVSPLKSPAQFSLRTRTISSSLRGDSSMYGPLPTINSFSYWSPASRRLPRASGRTAGSRRRRRSWSTARPSSPSASSPRRRRRRRSDRVRLTGERLGATVDEVEQVAVVAGEVGFDAAPTSAGTCSAGSAHRRRTAMPSLIVNVHTVASSLASNDSASSGTIWGVLGIAESRCR